MYNPHSYTYVLVFMADYEKSSVIFALKIFVGPKRITEDFVCNSIVHRRRMIKSIYIIKHGFIRAILF